jgi:hypothetical protein
MSIHGDAAISLTAIFKSEVSIDEANDGYPVLTFAASTLAVHKRDAMPWYSPL